MLLDAFGANCVRCVLFENLETRHGAVGYAWPTRSLRPFFNQPTTKCGGGSKHRRGDVRRMGLATGCVLSFGGTILYYAVLTVFGRIRL